MGICGPSDGYEWAVLYDDKLELADPIYGENNSVVRKVDNIMETTSLHPMIFRL